jgi:hypothetical protein
MKTRLGFRPRRALRMTVFCLPAADSSARTGDMFRKGMKTRWVFAPRRGTPQGTVRLTFYGKSPMLDGRYASWG